MGWRIVEVKTGEYMQLYLNNLMIKRELEKILINIRDIDLLIVHNDRATISIRLMNALTHANASVIFMNGKHEPSSHIIPVCGNHMSLKIIEKQINWKNVYKGNVWKEIIKNKLNNQKLLLKKIDVDQSIVEHFDILVNNVKSFDITNREGHGAKIFWHLQYGLNFKRDQKGNANSVINGMLNYGYAILRSLTITALVKKGLDTRIAFFHKSQGNFFALASDVMEPFRIIVDEIVLKYKDAKIFTLDIRDELIGIAERKVIINEKKHYLSSALEKVTESIINNKGWEWVDLWD